MIGRQFIPAVAPHSDGLSARAIEPLPHPRKDDIERLLVGEGTTESIDPVRVICPIKTEKGLLGGDAERNVAAAAGPFPSPLVHQHTNHRSDRTVENAPDAES